MLQEVNCISLENCTVYVQPTFPSYLYSFIVFELFLQFWKCR